MIGHHGDCAHRFDLDAALALEERRPKADPFDQVMRRYRRRFLAANKGASAELLKILRQFYEGVRGELLDPKLLTMDDAAIQAALRGHVADLRRRVSAYLQRSMIHASELTLLREAELVGILTAGQPARIATAVTGAIPASLVAPLVVDAISESTLGVGVRLSDKVWALADHASDQVTRVVRAGILQGRDAIKISEDLRDVIVPGSKGPLWHHGNAPARLKKRISSLGRSIPGRRNSISYNHLRLARTEMFRSQRLAHIARLQTLESMLPFSAVKGMRWNLSNSHPALDICDDWANTDSHGLGAGVYPPGETPGGHPNDLCYTTSELISVAEFKAQMQAARGRMGDPALIGSLSKTAGVRSFAEVLRAMPAEAIAPYSGSTKSKRAA